MNALFDDIIERIYEEQDEQPGAQKETAPAVVPAATALGVPIAFRQADRAAATT